MTKVAGTKKRNGTYHFNIPIPSKIQNLYPSRTPGKFKLIFDGTMKTTDAQTAKDKVEDQRAIFRQQLRNLERKEEQERIAATLDPADAALLAELGGVHGLLRQIKEQRAVAAFTLAGTGAELADDNYIEVEGGHETPPTRVSGGEPDTPSVGRLEQELGRREAHARIDHLTAETRRLTVVAGALGEDVPPPPDGIDEGITGIRELSEGFIDAHNYTMQNREAVANTVRRWVELHGDIPIEKWTRVLIVTEN